LVVPVLHDVRTEQGETMNDPVAAAFREASEFLVAAVRAIPVARWDQPGLGTWTVRQLVGHANRGQTTVEEYLRHPRPPEPPDSTYFTEESIAARGRESVEALGSDPAAVVGQASRSVVALVEQTDPGATIGSPARTMTLAEYLPSRVAELTIHGLDIVRAVDADVPVPAGALGEALRFVAAVAARRSGQEVLLALTGRGTLPAGYSVY
jgi:uncharacterized protein (TIGR03083 family)